MVHVRSKLVLPAVVSLLLVGTTVAVAEMPAGDVGDVLKARIGKSATIVLVGGAKEYTGVVGEVRDGSVVLQKLVGKEYYDAIVDLEAIAAVEIRRDG